MSSFTGGFKLDQVFAGQIKRLSTPATLTVGFLEGSTYPDGTSVPMVAAINEFGGNITVPAHEVTIYRKLLKNGNFAKGGQFVKASKSNFASNHMVAQHVIKIPSRPFFRSMLAQLPPDLNRLVSHLTVSEDYDLNKVLNICGKFISDRLQESIRAWSQPPNAKSTIRKKGFNKPLIDTGHMLNSVDYNIGDGK